MRNDELFRPDCPVKGVKELVNGYVLRGLTDSGGACTIVIFATRKEKK